MKLSKKYSLIEFNNIWLKMEEKEELFHKKNSNNIYFWDIVRFQIFDILYYGNDQINYISKKSFTQKLRTYYREIKNLFNSELLIKRQIRDKNFAFYICSRYTENKKNIDKTSRNIIETLNKRLFLIESVKGNEENNTFSNIYYPYKLLLLMKLSRKKSIEPIYSEINEILKRYFESNVSIEKLIVHEMLKFEVEEKFYLKLFSRKKINGVFFTQNGIQKGIISAAHILKIPTIEIQHGYIGKGHLAYLYPKNVSFKHLNTITDYFLLLSEFWESDINYPTQKNIVIGNDLFYVSKSNFVEYKNLLVICSNVHLESLLILTKKILNHQTDIKITFKCHPNQKYQMQAILAEFENYENINVIFDEVSVQELIKEIPYVLMIQSTVAYEALQTGCKLFVYEVEDYDTLSNIFDNPNVILVKNEEEVIQEIQFSVKNFSQEENIFFEKFNKEKFQKFLTEELGEN